MASTTGGARKHVSTWKYTELENQFQAIMKDKKSLQSLWRRIDYNGNGMVSLAEIDNLVVDRFPDLDNKPALMRAYKATTRGGDDYVQKHEFRALLRNLLYFSKVWALFEVADSDDDRRMDFGEFQVAYPKLGIQLTQGSAKEEFEFMDRNGGGFVLFNEFCRWVAEKRCPLE